MAAASLKAMPTIVAMTEPGNRERVERFFKALNDRDFEAMEKLVDPAYVWEMPQSGERVRGWKNNRSVAEAYPGGLPDVGTRRISGSEDKWVTTPSWTVLKITGSGDHYTAESIARYPEGGEWHAVDIFHFAGEKIVRHVAYFAAPLEAPAWRARWVERT